MSMVRSYGNSARAVERRYGLFMHIAVLMFALMTVANPAWAEAAKPIKLVVLGDSLSAGLGLPAQEAFPTKLQKALQDKGIEVGMTNAGVSGDTSSGGP
ncbi:lysophospholipase L1-like esterase [Bradyrhizobium sp. GM5.1]